MPGPNFLLDKGFKAMSAVPVFHCVKLITTAKEQVTLVTGTADKVIGICQDEVAAADAGRQVANIRSIGISRGIAGAAVTIGDNLVVTAAGRLIPQGGAAAGTTIVGIALTAATANGDHIDVFQTPGAKV